MAKVPNLVTIPDQLTLDLEIAAEREIDGIGMGVLSDGSTYLTLRGLAKMCGVDHSGLIRLTAQWQESPQPPRIRKIREIVRDQDGDDRRAFLGIKKDGIIHHAVPEKVCMAILEYYAFEAPGEQRELAARNYRLLARKSFRDFIYAAVGYNPTNSNVIEWQQFHDRVSLTYHMVPDGYFSVFKELADMIVTLIREGASLGPNFVPDISVGLHWGRHWTDNNLDHVYEARIKYPHSYPRYFPQSASNPQPAFCYPDESLPEFRKWMRDVYLKQKLPTYLLGKQKSGEIAAPAVTKALTALSANRKRALTSH
ncbi:hypothetical protein [Blastochloris sulfoviridis]|uniref:BstA-like C-terminal domain-containing protein n=1 Tax=Blastochloris sulfoviridis TaxID=50712 RepID=A0A5M6I3W2_9HYPH|nr:hypothetical protein [Blastochloris sulfoviridis]KAA5602901.1 hypothetical protein F1193_03445 [Blastochloris sulfoviridis]